MPVKHPIDFLTGGSAATLAKRACFHNDKIVGRAALSPPDASRVIYGSVAGFNDAARADIIWGTSAGRWGTLRALASMEDSGNRPTAVPSHKPARILIILTGAIGR